MRTKQCRKHYFYTTRYNGSDRELEIRLQSGWEMFARSGTNTGGANKQVWEYRYMAQSQRRRRVK